MFYGLFLRDLCLQVLAEVFDQCKVFRENAATESVGDCCFECVVSSLFWCAGISERSEFFFRSNGVSWCCWFSFGQLGHRLFRDLR